MSGHYGRHEGFAYIVEGFCVDGDLRHYCKCFGQVGVNFVVEVPGGDVFAGHDTALPSCIKKYGSDCNRAAVFFMMYCRAGAFMPLSEFLPRPVSARLTSMYARAFPRCL